jgi:beta-glucanase (GH16 family)
MLKFLAIFLLLIINSYGEEPTWSDEFNGTELDLTKWNYEEGARNQAVNTRSQVSVYDGCLHIKAQTINGVHKTAIISTEGKFEASYGYWEVKAKFNDQDATWSDVWLYSRSVTDPTLNIDVGGIEIDIFEHRRTDENANDISNTVVHALHWNGYAKSLGKGNCEIPSDNQFHIYGLDWQKDKLDFYIDKKLSWSAPLSSRKSCFLLISTEIGYLKDSKGISYWTQPIPKRGYNTETIIIDYIRYWKH